MKENIETSVKRFIRVPDVLNRVGFSRTTLYCLLYTSDAADEL